MAGAGGGIAIAGANMWAVLRNNDPGHSADDAVLHGRKLVKKAAAKAEEVAPPPRAAKPATKRGAKKGTKKATKRGAAGGGQQAAPAGAMDDMMERFKRIAMAAIYGKQMPLQAPAAVPAIPGLLPEHQPGGGEAKETPAVAAPSEEEEEEVVGIEWEYEEMGKVEEEGEFVAVVAKGGTVARRPRKAAAAEGVVAGGANMWAVLGDEDPGHGAAHGRKHKKAAAEVEEETPLADNVAGSVCSGSGDGGAKPAKRGKKTKKKKKCVIIKAEDKKQAVVVTVDTGEVTTEGNKLPSKGEMSEDEEGIAGGCRAVGRAVVAAAVIALWCRLVSPF